MPYGTPEHKGILASAQALSPALDHHGSAQQRHCGQEELTLQTRATPTAVLVEVMDTGIGMDEITRQRCLEPFYTTQGERGTGLGLAMVYGVLERHTAQLVIESAVGQGTTMRLLLPEDRP